MLLKTSNVYYTAPVASEGLGVAVIIGFILGIIGAVLIYVLFLKKDNEKKLTGFAKYLYEFLHFDKLCLEVILKFTYLFGAIFITVVSFGFISVSFLTFILFLIFGNLLLRISYEMSMILISMHKNVKEINQKLKK